jgi:multisubunit Na+/H+ antiporter MnhE subunit
MRKEVTITLGTLVIDIYDSTAKKLVWSGSASKTLDPHSSQEQRKNDIDKAAQKLFENYPPK